MNFRIDRSFQALFPEALVGIVVARRLDNRRNGDQTRSLLATAAREAAADLGDGELSSHPAIAPWREAYRRFGVKPSRYRSSIESLLRSARADGVRAINPLVDLYNAVSLRHLLPCGGEDLDAIRGDLRLTMAKGGEQFLPLGATVEEPPAPGEVIYADDLGVVCRAWNWREADRTKLTPETTRAVLVIEALPPRTEADLRAACEELAALASEHLGAVCRVSLLGANGVTETSLDA